MFSKLSNLNFLKKQQGTNVFLHAKELSSKRWVGQIYNRGISKSISGIIDSQFVVEQEIRDLRGSNDLMIRFSS